MVDEVVDLALRVPELPHEPEMKTMTVLKTLSLLVAGEDPETGVEFVQVARSGQEWVE